MTSRFEMRLVTPPTNRFLPIWTVIDDPRVRCRVICEASAAPAMRSVGQPIAGEILRFADEFKLQVNGAIDEFSH